MPSSLDCGYLSSLSIKGYHGMLWSRGYSGICRFRSTAATRYNHTLRSEGYASQVEICFVSDFSSVFRVEATALSAQRTFFESWPRRKNEYFRGELDPRETTIHRQRFAERCRFSPSFVKFESSKLLADSQNSLFSWERKPKIPWRKAGLQKRSRWLSRF